MLLQSTFLHSFFILHKCHLNISNIKSYLYESMLENKLTNQTVLIALINYVILETTSFLDEYDNKLVCKKNNEINSRIQEVKAICKPIMKKVKKWNLQAYRNSIIAHPWYKDGKSTVPNHDEYYIPRNFIEVVILADYMNYIYTIINFEFKNEIEEAINTTKKEGKLPEVHSIDLNQTNEDMIKLAIEVDKLCKKFNKPYFLKVQQYKFT